MPGWVHRELEAEQGREPHEASELRPILACANQLALAPRVQAIAEGAPPAEAEIRAWRARLGSDEDADARERLAELLAAANPLDTAELLSGVPQDRSGRLWRAELLGRALAHLEGPDDRLAMLEQISAIATLDVMADSEAAQLLRERGRMVEAMFHARRAAQSGPENPRSWRRLAQVARQVGDMEVEAEVTGRLLEFTPSDIKLRGRLARLLLDLGRDDEAGPHLDALRSARENAGA
jgi:tetratricopeptide (TPR) repeat protein